MLHDRVELGHVGRVDLKVPVGVALASALERRALQRQYRRVFSEAGIVATNIAIGGIKSHTPDDVPEQIDPASLERAARIVAGVVTRSIAALNPTPATQTAR
jgi:hypothetical protein